jgi:hypothetical protein
MRRAGSTLQYHLAREIVKDFNVVDLGFLIWQQFDDAYAKHYGECDFVVFKSHVHTPSLSGSCASMWSSQGYGLYIHRDIRDVMASLIRLYRANSAGGEALERVNLENDMRAIVNAEARRWLTTKKILVTRYEDILTVGGIANECSRIASHIGVEIEDDQCAEIAERFVLAKQKERLPKDSRYNSEFLLWQNHLFTGETGVWKDELTSEQIAFVSSLSLPSEIVR